MSAAVQVFLLYFCLRNTVGIYGVAITTSVEKGGAKPLLPPPQNINMNTLNTNYTVTWDWDQSQAEGHAVTFTTQYVAMYKLMSKRPMEWTTVCKETSRRSCDLTTFDLHYLGIYMIRVQASVNGSHSDWVQLKFNPDEDAALGPPTKVELTPAGSDLDIRITDPLTNNNTSMRDLVPGMDYYIIYWERSSDTQASSPKILRTFYNIVTLSNLTAQTMYCVRIQSRYDFYNKSSSFTLPQCMQTEGNFPWWKIFLCFLASLVLFFLLGLFLFFSPFWCYKIIKLTFYPSDQLPLHLKQYLSDSPGSDTPQLLASNSQSELLSNNFCVEPVVLEIHNPPPEALLLPPSGLEPDTSARHNRQDSSSSGDSGVYSTGGSSKLQQPNSGQSSMSTGSEELLQGSFNLAQVKMQEMTPCLKNQPLTADEGIADVCI